MALTQNTDAQEKAGDLIAYPVAGSVHLYKGALVCRNSSGYATPGADAASHALLGIAEEEVDTTGVAAGVKTILVRKRGTYVVKKTAAAAADLGVAVYVTADDTVAATSTHSVLAGYVAEIVSASKVRIRIDNAVR